MESGYFGFSTFFATDSFAGIATLVTAAPILAIAGLFFLISFSIKVCIDRIDNVKKLIKMAKRENRDRESVIPGNLRWLFKKELKQFEGKKPELESESKKLATVEINDK